MPDKRTCSQNYSRDCSKSSSNSSKFKYDELAGFVENNTIRSRMQKKEEEELCFQMVQRSTTTGTEQRDGCLKHCSQEKRSKNSKRELN